jgi:hypothetical protein
MMQGSRGVEAGLAGHDFRIAQMQKREKHNFMTVPLQCPLPPEEDPFQQFNYVPLTTQSAWAERQAAYAYTGIDPWYALTVTNP